MEYSKLTVENCRKIVSSCVTWDEEVHQAQCLQMQKKPTWGKDGRIRNDGGV